MTVPFDKQAFLALFADYNAAIWPMQIVAYGIGVLSLIALALGHPLRERVVLASLAMMWAWNGAAYHFGFFSTINPAAIWFGTFFLIQAALLGWAALVQGAIRLEPTRDWRTIVALATIAYALVIYEFLGVQAGHGLMRGPLFGVAPCPTTIFTLGVLLLARGQMTPWLAAIPLIWAAIGTSAAVMLGVPEDYGLAVSALLFVLLPLSKTA
jgi:Family of unknown function (DUF6064)